MGITLALHRLSVCGSKCQTYYI